MKTYRFTVPGPPFGKQSVRHTKSGHSFTPTETRVYMAKVRLCLKTQCPDIPCLTGGIRLHVCAYYPIPKSTPKWKRQAMLASQIEATVKPDDDNIRKIIADPMSGIAWIDDKQITKGCQSLFYSDEPEVIVQWWEVGPPANCTKKEFEEWNQKATAEMIPFAKKRPLKPGDTVKFYKWE